jgi:hypothetical protein
MPGINRNVDQIRDGLNDTVTALEFSIDMLRQEWAEDWPGDEALKVRDHSGQLILAPLYVGLAQAYAALVALGPSGERTVPLEPPASAERLPRGL